MAVIDHIQTLSENKAAHAADLLRQISDEMVSRGADRGPVSEVLDLAAVLTGYMNAPVPGGESRAIMTVLSTLLQYMTQRARDLTLSPEDRTAADLDSILISAIRQCTDLYAECVFNRAERPILKGSDNV